MQIRVLFNGRSDACTCIVSSNVCANVNALVERASTIFIDENQCRSLEWKYNGGTILSMSKKKKKEKIKSV